MVKFKQTGDFKNTEKYFKKLGKGDYLSGLSKFGELGVKALEAATPRKTGKTASSWIYSIEKTKKGVSLVWSNTNVNNGANIALLIQYGHGTRNGGYVEGVDYINPALKPLFDKIAKDAWMEVTNRVYY